MVMLGTELRDYQNFLAKEKAIRNPLEYYYEDNDKFIIMFRDTERNEIYSIIDKPTLRVFGEVEEREPQEMIDEFRLNYCFNARKVTSISDLNIQPEFTSNPEEPNITIRNSFTKSTDVDMVEEAEDYEDFMIKTVNKWERQVLSRIDEVPLEKLYDPDVNKGLGEFIRNLFNTVNTIPFMKTLRVTIKKSMNEGIELAEKDVSLDIGWSEGFNDTLKLLEEEQIEGYNINGKPWYGIKGATKELQFNILKQVEEDIRNKSTKAEMTDNIKHIFDGSTTAQAKRIARTETTRFINMSRMQGWKEAGVSGKKAWDAVGDGRTRPTHKQMAEIYKDGIPFDEDFFEPGTGKAVQYPPLDPNCRCAIKFVPISK